MTIRFKKLFFLLTFNISLFLLLMIGIQNSTYSKKVNFIMFETISLPIGFIAGVSFISGSLTSSLLNINFDNKE